MKSTPVVITNSDPRGDRHDFGYASSPDLIFQNRVYDMLAEYVPKRGQARRIADKILRKVDYTDYAEAIPAATRTDLVDRDYVSSTVCRLVKIACPTIELPEDFIFALDKLDSGEFRVVTNFNFERLRAAYTRKNADELTPAHLLAHFIQTRGDIELAARYGGDLATNQMQAIVVGTLAKRIIESACDQDVTGQLQEFSVASRRISEVINSGEKKLVDFVSVLERASKFRQWLRDKDYDADLVAEYVREATAETWVDKLPTKTTRWVLFSALGLAADAVFGGSLGAASALAVSALDSFFLDKLVKGWRPNQFITGPLRTFLSDS